MKKETIMLVTLCLALVSCNTRVANRQVNKKKEGQWIEEYSLDSSHYKSIGYYKNDNPIKRWRYYLDGKTIKKEKYRIGFCKTKFYHKNGQLQSKGKTVLDTTNQYPHWYYSGEWKQYNDKEQLISRRHYLKGELKSEEITSKTKTI
jgi:hypothetical protein